MKRNPIIRAPIVAILLFVGATFTIPVQAQGIPGLSQTELDDFGNGLYAFRYNAYRNIFIVTDEGVIATDPLGVKEAAAMREEIAKITDKPMKYVAYSHSHWDHATGGQIFRDEGAQFVAQEKCLENITDTPRSDLVPPDITFSDNYKIELGGRSLELYYYGPSHDNCMVVMIARPANMLFVVDIGSAPTGWFMEYNPTMSDTHLYNIVPFLKATEDLMEREGVETIISGHLSTGYDDDGNLIFHPSSGPASAIGEKIEFWEMLFGFVRREIESGTFVEDMPDKLIANQEFQNQFVEHVRRGYEEDEMWILLRRVGSYITSGR